MIVPRTKINVMIPIIIGRFRWFSSFFVVVEEKKMIFFSVLDVVVVVLVIEVNFHFFVISFA